MSDLALSIRSPPQLALAGRLSSDERLARLVSRGSTRAFAILYQRHHQALYRYCRSIVRDEDDAQDALQSAMMRALTALQARERDLAVRPWLFRIVHNEAVSVIRRRRPHASLIEGLEPTDGGVEHTLEKRERFAQLLADLQSLAERQRAALVMRELSGLPIEEIAAALSISSGAAKQALLEARCALQEFAEGRAMECEAVRRVVSEGDGRVLRGRKIRAHLRGCPGCRDFRRTIVARTAELCAFVPPLPAAAATAMLARLLAQGAGGGHAGGAAVASGVALGKPAAASLTAKAIAGVAILTAATAGTVHLASRSDGHKPAAPATRRVAPLPSSEAGNDFGIPSGMWSSGRQPPRSDSKALGLATSGREPSLAGTPERIGPTSAGPLSSRATAVGEPSGRAAPAGARRRHSGQRRFIPPQSRHTNHGYRRSNQAHLKPPRQRNGRGDGRPPAPAAERIRGNGGAAATSQARPGNESPPSSATKTQTG